MSRLISLALAAILSAMTFPAHSQALYQSSARVADAELPDSVLALIRAAEARADSILALNDSVFVPTDTVVAMVGLPSSFFIPPVYDTYHFCDTATFLTPELSGDSHTRWIEEYDAQRRNVINLQRSLFFSHPELVRYNTANLPEAPKKFHAVLNPTDHTITIHETVTGPAEKPTISSGEIKKRHWIRDFRTSLQFSQAYVSPNWYQGGNKNLNAIAHIYYNVKLNQEYHPNLLFDTTMQYKLGINNAPDDSLRSYNVSEDLLQINTTFGIKAAKRWYYSFTGQFKTQLLKNYKSNTRTLKSAFLSPGDLTAGIGMTYNYATPKKNFTLDASLAPLTYNLRICISDEMDPTKYDIKPGHKTVNKFGSSAEFKLFWRVSYNITFNSRLFAFTEFEHAQADWENTLAFEINRFLTTQIYVHLRYDSATAAIEDSNWHKLQLKEIFSIGFAYKFKSI